MNKDWTSKDGCSNSSDLFNKTVKDVEGLIIGSAVDLIKGRSDLVARFIVAHLAHANKLSPR